MEDFQLLPLEKGNTPEFKQRLADIRNNKFKDEIERYMKMETPELQGIYKQFQATKGASV